MCPDAHRFRAAAHRRRVAHLRRPGAQPRSSRRRMVLRGGAPSMAKKTIDKKDLLKDLEAIGRKLQDVGRTLVTATGKTVKSAADETLEIAEDALSAAHKN